MLLIKVEKFLINSHIPLYKQSSYNNHNPKNDRKLLLKKKKEINKLIGRINRDGLTIVPTKLYFLKGKAKVEIAVAKGKKLYDKRETIKKKRLEQRESQNICEKKQMIYLSIGSNLKSIWGNKIDNINKCIFLISNLPKLKIDQIFIKLRHIQTDYSQILLT